MFKFEKHQEVIIKPEAYPNPLNPDAEVRGVILWRCDNAEPDPFTGEELSYGVRITEGAPERKIEFWESGLKAK